MIKLDAERIRMEVDGILPVIVARAGDIEVRIPLDQIRTQQIAAAVRRQAAIVQKMSRQAKGWHR